MWKLPRNATYSWDYISFCTWSPYPLSWVDLGYSEGFTWTPWKNILFFSYINFFWNFWNFKCTNIPKFASNCTQYTTWNPWSQVLGPPLYSIWENFSNQQLEKTRNSVTCTMSYPNSWKWEFFLNRLVKAFDLAETLYSVKPYSLSCFLTKAKSNHRLFYEWCTNPLECIPRG